MKMDRKLLSRQKHEIAYVRKLARRYLKITKEEDRVVPISTFHLIRLCKAVLKFAK